MRFAEVFLRLGCSLVAWMILATWVLWLAALHEMACGPDGDHMHQLLLWLAPLALVATVVQRVTRPFADTHRLLTNLGIPLALLLPFALRNVWGAFSRTALAEQSLCSAAPPESWQLMWAPAQAAILAGVAWMLVREWRNSRIAPP